MKANNFIRGISTPNGQWTTNIPIIKHILLNYFKHLYSRESNSNPQTFNCEYSSSHTLHDRHIIEHKAPISYSETKLALKSLNPWKASGLDAFPAGFFQHHWNMMNNDIYEHIKGWQNGTIDLQQFNSTLITLIHK